MKFLVSRPFLAGALLSLALLLMREGAVSADGPPDGQSARVQYARAYVAMTQLELQVAEARNQTAPNTLPLPVIAGLRQHVAISEIWLREVESGEAGKPFNGALETAQIFAKGADGLYAAALRRNGIVAVDPRQLAVLRQRTEVARLRVAVAKEIDLSSPAALAQYQLERLREEVAELTAHRVNIGDVD